MVTQHEMLELSRRPLARKRIARACAHFVWDRNFTREKLLHHITHYIPTLTYSGRREEKPFFTLSLSLFLCGVILLNRSKFM